MQKVNNNKEMAFLVEDIEALLEMNRLLEKENQELKHEISKLKSQISSLKAHDIERKSILWKKLQNPINNNVTSTKEGVVYGQQKHVVSQASEKPSSTPPPPPTTAFPPPPPPPMPCKAVMGSKLAVRRVPQVIEFYRYLNKRNAKIENRANGTGSSIEGINNNPRNMIGEIENRSMYHSAIEKEHVACTSVIFVEETAIFKDISEVEAFVKHLDEELSCLVDERAVLKHFPQWPERKADAIREAACCFRDLKNLESELLSYKDNPKQPLPKTLQRLQTLQDRLERVIENIEKTRESTCKRYRDLQIPWEWMLDSGLVGQNSRLLNAENVLHQGARFAYRVHQFAGGFDIDTEHVFEELKRIRTSKFPEAN
uniref:CHUP1-like protein b n=1 Tax=Bienertia sinuspersici TaxID=338654 RepID=A0A890CAB4_9CARY|nr:CHUP1-like protein b [Bienertia sinuspersici]